MEGQEEAEEDRSGGTNQGLLAQLVKSLVRYALACEHSRIPIRRDAIREKG